MKVGRNDICPCGSGQKYKKCCRDKDEAAPRQTTVAVPSRKAPATPDWTALPEDFQALQDCVDEEFGWLVEGEECDLDVILPRWLDACSSDAQRLAFEERLSRFRRQSPRPYLHQGMAAFLGLLRVVNALEMQRPDIVRTVLADVGSFLESDLDHLDYWDLLSLLAFHEQRDLLLLAARGPSLQGEDARRLSQIVAGHLLPADSLCAEFARQVPGTERLMAAIELQCYLGGDLVPHKKSLQQYWKGRPCLQSLLLFQSIPAWLDFLLGRALIDRDAWSGCLDTLRKMRPSLLQQLQDTPHTSLVEARFSRGTAD